MVTPGSSECAVAFKEWAGVCDALIDGRQILIIRKGGIDETAGAGEFVPEHHEFWLYPTQVHQAEQVLRAGSEGGVRAGMDSDGGSVLIRGLVAVDLIAKITSEQMLKPLEEFHIFTTDTILKRFQYRRPGLWVLGARAWRRDPGVTVAKAPEHAGCRSWVVLDDPLPKSGLVPVFDDDQWDRLRLRLRSVLDLQS